MGSPIVFHTAPPQPASKARIICSPQFVGGAEASQNGLGDLIPAVFAARLGALWLVVESGMNGLLLAQSMSDAQSRAFAIGYRVDDFATAVDAIAPGKVLGIRSPA